jgi:hypothetical protein
MLDVDCPRCGKKIANYTGPLGAEVPIESHFYTRLDGSQPTYGSSTTHTCPFCKQKINELEAVLSAVSEFLYPASKREQTEQFLTEKGNGSAPDRSE